MTQKIEAVKTCLHPLVMFRNPFLDIVHYNLQNIDTERQE